MELVAQFLDIQLAALEKNESRNLLADWAQSAHQSPYSVFNGTTSMRYANIPLYSITLRDDLEKFVLSQTREAENSVREEMNLPRVGEGWIGETELFYALLNALPDTEVVQHARPKWLGRQHLDVFIPAYSVAFEYQGLQHDQPVEFFGGQEAFEQTQKRDAEKKRKCRKQLFSSLLVPNRSLHAHLLGTRPVKNLQKAGCRATMRTNSLVSDPTQGGPKAHLIDNCQSL